MSTPLKRAAYWNLATIITLLVWPTLMAAVSARTTTLRPTRPAQSSPRPGNTAHQDGRPSLLVPGNKIEREMAGAQAHSYQITLTSGQYLRVVVDQRGVDVAVAIFDPHGEAVVKVNNLNGTEVPETVLLVAEASGTYRLEVRCDKTYAALGRYEIRVDELRMATGQDRTRVAADRAFMEAERLRSEGKAVSLQRSMEIYEEVLPIWQSLGERGREAETLYSIGIVHSYRGAQGKAIEFYNRARPLMQAEGQRREQAFLLTDIGRSYYLLGEREYAIELYNEALSLMRAVGEPAGEALTLNRIGVVYSSFKETRKALDLYMRALPLMRAASNRNGEAYTLAHIGTAYQRLGKMQKALEYQSRALLLIQTTDDRDGEAYMLSNVGSVYQHLGETERALEFYRRALQINRSSGNSAGRAIILYKIARAHFERGSFLEARAHIESALEIIESLRTEIGSQQLRASYFSTVQEYYDFYIELLMRLHEQDPAKRFDAEAMEVSERARARSLLELLVEARADIRHGVDPALLESERSLHSLLNAKAEDERRLLNTDHAKEQAAAAAKEVEILVTKYKELWAQIRAQSPRYAALIQPRPLSLGEIQQVLDPDTLLLEYRLGDERSYLWALTQSSVTSYELPERAEIDAVIAHFYELLTARQPRQKEAESQYEARVARADAQYRSVAAALSQLLLGPVASHLGTKRLLIVADGSVQFVSFAALPVPATAGPTDPRTKGKNIDADDSQVPLIVGHEIVSLPSVSALAVLRRETALRIPASKAVAIFADPVFDMNDPRVKLNGSRRNAGASARTRPSDLERAMRDAATSGDREALSRLPFSREEAEAIFAVAPSGQVMKAIDFKASRATALGPELGQYRIVHFATHGFLNSKHPELTGIALSLVDERGAPQDGFLRLHEVYNLNLPTELVVLSGCKTALGKQISGEGLVGLTQGFMYAGARRVMASLWSVNDSVTAELMKHFYEGVFIKGLQPSAALQAAQINLRQKRRWRSPYYWAAFVLQGEWRP